MTFNRTIESTLRTMNNLLERLHASFFFYILTKSHHPNGHPQFLKIGHYLPSVIMISVATMFVGLRTWVEAGWTRRDKTKDAGAEEKQDTSGDAKAKANDNNGAGEKPNSEDDEWVPRRRPVLDAVFVMLACHGVGAAIFFLASNGIAFTNGFLEFSVNPSLIVLAVSLSYFNPLDSTLTCCFAGRQVFHSFKRLCLASIKGHFHRSRCAALPCLPCPQVIHTLRDLHNRLHHVTLKLFARCSALPECHPPSYASPTKYHGFPSYEGHQACRTRPVHNASAGDFCAQSVSVGLDSPRCLVCSIHNYHMRPLVTGCCCVLCLAEIHMMVAKLINSTIPVKSD